MRLQGRKGMTMPAVYIFPGGSGTWEMVRVFGRPLLEWQLLWLARQGCTDVALLPGMGLERIREYFRDGRRWNVSIRYAAGDGPGCVPGDEDACVILNGGMVFDVPLAWLIEYRRRSLARDSVCCALKYAETAPPHGCVRVDASWAVCARGAPERGQTDGYTDGGVYVAGSEFVSGAGIDRGLIDSAALPGLLAARKLFGIPFGGGCLDIGHAGRRPPADTPIETWLLGDKTPTLFLDRDGILIEDTGYVKAADGLVYDDRFFELSRKASDKGFTVVVVSNQAGVAKGYIGVEDVEAVNRRILERFESFGVRPAGFYWCPYHEKGTRPEWTRRSLQRKPEPGMVLKAVGDHGIDPLRSLMVGDRDTDRIRLPYLRSFIVPGRHRAEAAGDVVDISAIEQALEAL